MIILGEIKLEILRATPVEDKKREVRLKQLGHECSHEEVLEVGNDGNLEAHRRIEAKICYIPCSLLFLLLVHIDYFNPTRAPIQHTRRPQISFIFPRRKRLVIHA